MTAQSKIVEITRSQGDADGVEPSESLQPAPIDEQHDEAPSPEHYDGDWPDEGISVARPWGRIALFSILIVAAAAWIGFYIWAYWGELSASPAPTRLAEMLVGVAVPLALLAVCWLLAMRLSSTEARRFGDVAALLRNESISLEDRMRTVNGEIALARAFLAEQTRELETVGRLSAQRLTEAAEQLSRTLTDADERAKMLQVASNAAVANVEQLRNHLPVVTSAAKDATNQIGIAGNTAHSYIQAIVSTVGTMVEDASKAGESLTELDTRLSTSAERLEQRLRESSEQLATAVEGSGARAEAMLGVLNGTVDAAGARLAEMADTLDAKLAAGHDRLLANLEALSAAMARLENVTHTQDAATSATIDRVKASIAECQADLAGFDDASTDRIAKLAFAVSALSGESGELGSTLAATQERTDKLIASVEAMQSGLAAISHETAENLSAEMSRIDARLVDLRASYAAARGELAEADAGSNALIESVSKLETMVSAQRGALDILLRDSASHFAGQQEQVDALSAAISHTRSILEEVSGVANDQLVASLLRVRETTRQAAESSRKLVEEELAQIAEQLSDQNRKAIASAVDEQVSVLDIAMREAFDRNLTFAEQVESKIAAQMRKLEEMAGNLELRVANAHAAFGGLDDEGFARRMALLTESLNSAAIDVAKILSNDVTDTAWAAYLKGDRGVFTRRAVRLLDSGEAKIIANHYDEDAEFREHVNRYIHDFEAMMRVLLSTRDGNAIGVTLLSSDVGKLYVALAQAIERLRS